MEAFPPPYSSLQTKRRTEKQGSPENTSKASLGDGAIAGTSTPKSELMVIHSRQGSSDQYVLPAHSPQVAMVPTSSSMPTTPARSPRGNMQRGDNLSSARAQFAAQRPASREDLIEMLNMQSFTQGDSSDSESSESDGSEFVDDEEEEDEEEGQGEDKDEGGSDVEGGGEEEADGESGEEGESGDSEAEETEVKVREGAEEERGEGERDGQEEERTNDEGRASPASDRSSSPELTVVSIRQTNSITDDLDSILTSLNPILSQFDSMLAETDSITNNTDSNLPDPDSNPTDLDSVLRSSVSTDSDLDSIVKPSALFPRKQNSRVLKWVSAFEHGETSKPAVPKRPTSRRRNPAAEGRNLSDSGISNCHSQTYDDGFNPVTMDNS